MSKSHDLATQLSSRAIEATHEADESSNEASLIAMALAFTVPQFCRLHSLSRATYYNLAREGRAPASMKVGRRRLIARESAEAWRRAMEQAGA
jgi:predicted DNA-binding transcriptional regulator AlpA